jgi:hypothetical protein
MLAVRFCRRARRWALPTVFVLAVLSVLPSEGRLGDREMWRSPSVNRQFSNWSGSLSKLGLRVTAEELRKRSWSAVQAYLGLRRALLWPWLKVQRQLGIGQSWALFTTPQTDPCRLLIEVQTAQGWVPIYASRSEQRTWHRAMFDHHRFRKLLGRIGRTEGLSHWNALSEWIIERVRQELPEVRQVRITLWRWATPEPQSVAQSVELDERGTLVRTVLSRLREGS